jgi:adenylate kinase
MNIVLLGPQGSGKGTQAKLLVEKFNLYYFEMGSFLRELAKTDPLIYEYQNKKGKLVPDDMFFFAMKALLKDKVDEKNNLLLDGFPRSVSQYETLRNWFSEFGVRLDLVIFIDISEEETIRRLSNRRTCTVCGKIWNLATSPIPKDPNKCECGGELMQRADDKPEQIKLRLEEYRKNTEPLLGLFEKENILVKVDGSKPIEEIAKKLEEIVQKTKDND